LGSLPRKDDGNSEKMLRKVPSLTLNFEHSAPEVDVPKISIPKKQNNNSKPQIPKLPSMVSFESS
jgi:hypothetical protein